MLINIQPVRQTMAVEVRLASGRCRPAGVIRETAETHEDMRSSMRTLAELAAQGWFVPCACDDYLLEFHFGAAVEWERFLARPKAGRAELDDLVLAAAWEDPEGVAVAVDETHIATFGRRGPIR